MDDRTADDLFTRVAELLHASDARSQARFDALDSRMDHVHAVLREFRAATEANYDRLVNRFDGLESRVVGLESRFAAFETRLTTFETKVYLRFDGLEERLAVVEGR